MSISDLDNTPIEISFGGKKIKVQRLSIKEIFTPAETKIKSDYIANIQLIASTLVGKEKIEYLTKATSDVPKGGALNQAATEYLGSPNGIADTLIYALNKHQSISEDEATNLILKSTEDERTLLFSYLSGQDSQEVSPEKKLEPTPTLTQEQKNLHPSF